ncbi:MGMT family protein [Olsenella massiliensis]|uniref:MGMT family protein n=1 Tax=Olsenella massiliensis TaxID=1622075 RepID=UPI0009EC3A77
MGRRLSPHVVGGAIIRNIYPVIVACHCVIGINDNLTNFSSGIDEKITFSTRAS